VRTVPRRSGVEQLGEGKEWHGGVLLEAAADEHHVSSVPCMGEHLASQPGFADAWLAAEQHKTPAAGNRTSRREQMAELGIASNQRRAIAAQSDHVRAG
jgi:hypothetical protein